MSLLELFCDVDDFMLKFAPQWRASQVDTGKQRERAGQLCPSEVMTILIHFHQSHYRSFKAYYTKHVQVYLTQEFPLLVSYSRFVALIPGMLVPLLAYAAPAAMALAPASVLSIPPPWKSAIPGALVSIGSRAADARRGKSSMGWFYGFKLHLAVNDRGELLACCLTPGNVDDRQPVPAMVKQLRGKLFGDRGYISAPLASLLARTGTPAHHTVTQKHAQTSSCCSQTSFCYANGRSSSPSLTSSRICAQIEHSRHRSPTNFVVHLLAGLIAYSHQDKKPSLHLDARALLAA